MSRIKSYIELFFIGFLSFLVRAIIIAIFALFQIYRTINYTIAFAAELVRVPGVVRVAMLVTNIFVTTGRFVGALRVRVLIGPFQFAV